jgi:hypothetical protein
MQYSADGRHPRRKVELTAGQPYNVPTFGVVRRLRAKRIMIGGQQVR